MEAGRELDALIAEKVMGWKRMSYMEAEPGCKYPSPERITGYWHSLDLKEQRRAEDCDDYYSPEDAWSPSTDIASAWEVVEKMGRHEISIHMRSDSNTDCVTKRYYLMDYTCRALLAEAETAPHAICLAALKAIEHV